MHLENRFVPLKTDLVWLALVYILKAILLYCEAYFIDTLVSRTGFKLKHVIVVK